MLLAQAAGAFDGRMRQIAGGVVFEEVGKEVKALLGSCPSGFRREIRAMGRREALYAFDDVAAAGKAARGEARRQQPVLRGLTGVEGLAHRPELRFEPRRLRPGNAERSRRRDRLQAQKPSASSGSAETSQCPGRMKAKIVVAGPEGRA